MCIIGIDGWGIVGDGSREIGLIGNHIRDEINRWRLEMPADVQRAFPQEQFTQFDGTDGKNLEEVKKAIQGYVRRIADTGEGVRGPHIEGCVLFGFSDGASTIYQLFERAFVRSAFPANHAANAGAPISFVGFLDMVRKDPFSPSDGGELRKDPPHDSRSLTLRDEDHIRSGRVYFETSADWKGYRTIGSLPNVESQSIHLLFMGDPSIREHLQRSAVDAYMEHVNSQVNAHSDA